MAGHNPLTERLRLVEAGIAKSRERLRLQEEELKRLQSRVQEFSGGLETLRQKTASTVARAQPSHPISAPKPPPPPRRQPVPLSAPAPVLAAPKRRARLPAVLPYALLAAASLLVGPGAASRPAVSPQALARVPARLPEPDRSQAAIALVLSFRPQGAERNFAQLIGPQLDTAGPSAWQAQSVGNGVYLVSFRPRDVRGPQADYEFTVDVQAKDVTPEPDTYGRLFAGI